MLRIRPVTRAVARAFVAAHHSHHRAHVGETFTLGAFEASSLVGVLVWARPVARALDDGETWECTRLCIGPGAPRFAASRLLGAGTRVAIAAGITLGVSYTRVDEPGSCYLAANWTPVEVVRAQAHDKGAAALRWLPGLYEPSSEIVDRVRWEIGPRAGERGATWDADARRWR